MQTTQVKAAIEAMADAIRCDGLTTSDIGGILSRITGGSDATGTWTWRQAYDLMQGASCLVEMERTPAQDPHDTLEQLIAASMALPTETRRSERQIQLQQFSSTGPLAYLVATAADLIPGGIPGGIVLEPSAGAGRLAAEAYKRKTKLILNEIDPFRRKVLSAVFGQDASPHDAEHIDDLLDRDIAPSVVLMNPPFSSSVSRRGDPTIALRHVLSAAKRLRQGGRLIAILPRNANPSDQPELWAAMCSKITPHMLLCMPKETFAKMGTRIEVALLVADKISQDADLLRTETCTDLHHALETISLLPDRARLAPLAPSALPNLRKSASAPSQHPARSTPSQPTPRRASLVAKPLGIRTLGTPRANTPVSDVYARYRPQCIDIDGAVAHPTALVESLAMASVHPPIPTATPSLPERLVAEGALSEAQLETIAAASSTHDADLAGSFDFDEDGTLVLAPDGEGTPFRQGYFLGDGTGAGKGRQVAGLIMANWIAGRDRAIWISKSTALLEDAIRDWSDLGGAPTDIQPLSRWKADEEIPLSRGILFVTYGTLRASSKSGRSRLDQIFAWAGDDFEGVIAFDEAHAMANAIGSKEGRGALPSQQGQAGLKLQHILPRARVLYVSATGATSVGNLAYATRLGIWGPTRDYPFPSRENFIAAMEAGGVAAMEVVARDLKALGLYTARALSFEGVEYDLLEHQMSGDDITVYDTFARAFKTIHANLQTALEATNITDAASGTGDSAAKSAALSRFESTKQRFFGHLLAAMKARTVLDAIKADVDEGFAPVVQIVSTGEAHLNRAIEGADAQDDLTAGHLTPKEAIIHYLETAFPVQARKLVAQDDGPVQSVPMTDEDGRPIICREAEQLRDAAILELQCLAPIPSFLDQLIWEFGEDGIAEVTGRSKRPLKTPSGDIVIKPRSASANTSETDAFMSGAKDILVFSDAGGTGRSYHASLKAKNQKRRRHYLVEPGWRADAAIQGLGRTHRSAQASAPFFRVCTTDVKGETRFTSTIARRLDTLGAMTRGQRETGSQNLFRASDNLESPVARRALRSLYADLARNGIEDMSYERFHEWTSLRLIDSEGVLLEDLPPIQRFLNRVLALPIAMQNHIFDAFRERIEQQTERARAAGTLDIGLEMLRADTIRVDDGSDLRSCPKTGAVTRTYTIETEDRITYDNAQTVLAKYPGYQPVLNRSSGNVALVATSPTHIYDDDGFSVCRQIIRVEGRSHVPDDTYRNSHWDDVSPDFFIKKWTDRIAALPKVKTRKFALLTGLLLPIWKHLPTDHQRIYRVAPENGPARLGRAISLEQAVVLKSTLTGIAPTVSSDIIASAIAGTATEIGHGLTLRARRVAGQMRLEIEGFAPSMIPSLKAQGCFTEIIAHQMRVFIPNDETAPDIVEKLGAAPSEEKAAA